MRRFYLAILAVALTTFGIYLAGCGGGAHHQPSHPLTASDQRLLTPTAKCPHGPLYQPCGKHRFDFARHGVPAPGGRPLANGGGTVEMQDTIDVGTIVGHPYACAGYTSGYWPTYIPLLNSGKCGRVVSIAINDYHTAQCLDVEPGDASPSQAGAWVRAMQRAGVWKPCLYSSTSMMYSVKGNLAAWHIGRGEWREWCAHYTYYAHLEGDCDGVQWTERAYGLNLDESTMKLSFFQGAKPAPPPGPSNATLGKWRKGKLAARHAWDKNHCGDHPLKGACPHYRRLVVAYQLRFQREAHYPAVKCWGVHAKKGEAVCDVLRPSVPAWAGAAASSRKQYWSRGCQHHPQRHDCVVFKQRTAWFNARWKTAQQLF